MHDLFLSLSLEQFAKQYDIMIDVLGICLARRALYFYSYRPLQLITSFLNHFAESFVNYLCSHAAIDLFMIVTGFITHFKVTAHNSGGSSASRGSLFKYLFPIETTVEGVSLRFCDR